MGETYRPTDDPMVRDLLRLARAAMDAARTRWSTAPDEYALASELYGAALLVSGAYGYLERALASERGGAA